MRRKKYIDKRKFDCRDYYRGIRKKYGRIDVDEKTFRLILVDLLENLFYDRLMNYKHIMLPSKLGRCYLEDIKCGFRMARNGIHKRGLVDWPKTYELWNYDRSMQKKGIYVYQDLNSFAKYQFRSRGHKYCRNAKYYDLVLELEKRHLIYHRITKHEKNWTYK